MDFFRSHQFSKLNQSERRNKMKKPGNGLFLLLGVFLLILPAFLASPVFAQKTQEVAMTTWPLGTGFHAVSTAITESARKVSGIRTSVIPTGDDTGRLLPIKRKEALFTIGAASTGWLATNGMDIFANPQWGPQPLRVFWRGGDYFTSFFTRADAGIQSFKDLKGKRIPQVPGSPTLSWLLEGAVAFGGHTLKDVQVVNVPGYAQGIKGLSQGTVDLWVGTPTTALVQEVAASRRGIRFLDLNPNDQEAWKRLWKFAPWAGYGTPTEYPTKEAGHPPFTAMKYANFFWTYDFTNDQIVYEYARGIWEGYAEFKDKHPTAKDWDHKAAADISGCFWPFHPGLIKFLKEKGVWTGEHEKFQERELNREAARMNLWKEATDKAKDKGTEIGGKDFNQMWLQLLIEKGLWR
jgi:uncharacterized protein